MIPKLPVPLNWGWAPSIKASISPPKSLMAPLWIAAPQIELVSVYTSVPITSPYPLLQLAGQVAIITFPEFKLAKGASWAVVVHEILTGASAGATLNEILCSPIVWEVILFWPIAPL